VPVPQNSGKTKCACPSLLSGKNENARENAPVPLSPRKSKKESDNRSVFVGVIREEFNAYLDVYRNVGDRDGTAKMAVLIRQLEGDSQKDFCLTGAKRGVAM